METKSSTNLKVVNDPQKACDVSPSIIHNLASTSLPVSNLSASELARLGILKEQVNDLSPLDYYLQSNPKQSTTILTRFDNSLIGVADHTRKAYNLDVWLTVAMKFFHAWDLPPKYNPIAEELLRLEVMKSLGERGKTNEAQQSQHYERLRRALQTLAAWRQECHQGASLTETDQADSRDLGHVRMALRGSASDRQEENCLNVVRLNSKDKAILHYIVGKFEKYFDVEFWNHFFSPDSLGGLLREQQARGNSPTTLARKMASLRRFEDFLGSSGLLTRPILFMQRRPRCAPTAQIVLRGDELNQIAKYLDQAARPNGVAIKDPNQVLLLVRDRAMFAILDQYLIRASALCSLQMRDIDLKRGCMRVVEKGRKEKVFSLERYAFDCLKDFLEVRGDFLGRYPPLAKHEQFVFHTTRGRGMNRRSLSRIIDQRATESGIEAQVGDRKTIGAHVIRRSGGNRYIEAGAPIEAVSQLMNHSNISTTWRYVGGASIDLSTAVFDKIGRNRS